MLRTIQSNIDDRYPEGSPFSEPFLRSVTVFAVGDPVAVRDSDTMRRLRERALELLGVDTLAESDIDFGGTVLVGTPFGVPISGFESHLVRAVDGPLAEEIVRAVRVVGARSWR